MEAERSYLGSCLESLHLVELCLHRVLRSAAALRERVRQLIEITDEDHGKAIRVFTIVTVLFLPMYVRQNGPLPLAFPGLTMPQDLCLRLLRHEHG